ncbi:MAG: hypothetical protein AB7K71_29665 [Polyangiaceae bacterium]
MRVCPSCGSTNEPYAVQCVVCGGSLEGAPETRRPAQSDLAQTRLGVPSVAEQQGTPSQVSPTASGDPDLGERSAAPPPQPAKLNLGGTQLLPPQAAVQTSTQAQTPTQAQPPREPDPAPAATPQANPNLLRTQVQYHAPSTQSSPQAAPEPAQNPNLGKATMLGMPPMSASAAGAPSALAVGTGQSASPQGNAELAKGTMLGMPPMSSAPPQANAVKGTMLGIAPVDPAQVAALERAEAERAQAAQAAQAAAPASQALPSEKRTMLGVAMPGIAPTGNVGPQSVTSEKRTMLGVAMPGIAPVHAGQAAAAPAHYPDVPPPQSLAEAPQSIPRGKPVWPWLLVGLAVLILFGGVGLWFFLRPSTPVSARLETSEGGQEELVLSCLACPDQTKVKLTGEGSEASFSSGRANLSLSQPLSVGDHELTLDLTRPGSKPESVKLKIGVDYRVKVDISALEEDPPKLALSVEARPGSDVEVEGKPLKLDSDGKGRWTEAVSQQLTGPAKGVERLERELSYRVSPPDSPAESGKTKVQIGIAPLVVEAPLDAITVDKPRFLLAGTTQPDVEVSVAGRAIKRQADGSFSQVMNVSTTGETTIQVKGTLAKHAPRFIPIHVKRVNSLEDAAKDFRTGKLASYSSVASQLGKSTGAKVAWPGKITDARSSEHRNILLLDVSSQCSSPPCLARVVYAGETPLKSGDQITVFGEVKRGVPGPRKGQTLPEVEAEFVLEGSK